MDGYFSRSDCNINILKEVNAYLTLSGPLESDGAVQPNLTAGFGEPSV